MLRSAGTLAMLTHDLRDAARNLRRNRGFAAAAIAILAIRIAASTGLFAWPRVPAWLNHLVRTRQGYSFITVTRGGNGLSTSGVVAVRPFRDR